MLRGAAVWAGVLGVVWLPNPGWAAPSPAAASSAPLSPAALPESSPAPRRVPSALRPEAFGRWQPRLQSCERTLPGIKEADCGAVLVDQRSAGVMRVSWPGRAGSGQASVLTFVGVVSGVPEPMACRQAICSLSKPIELTLSTVSLSLFDGRGVASALPSAWPVNGSCRLEASRIRCEAKAFTGESWTASATLN